MASATPWMESASWVSWCRILLVLEASLPPFRSKAFPLAIARAATWNMIDRNLFLTLCDSVKKNKKTMIVKSPGWALTCGRQSGRDSKMTSRTPMGTVICSNSRLLATLVLLSTRPTLSLEDTASWRRPMARLFSLAVDRLKRLIRAWGKRPAGECKRQGIRTSTVHFANLHTENMVDAGQNTWQQNVTDDPNLWMRFSTQWKCYTSYKHSGLLSAVQLSARCLFCASVPDIVANSMSLLLALRISSFFSVSSSARQQMISSLW